LLRRSGVTGTIVVCASELALAGSPQLHERIYHQGTRPAHHCAITLPNAGKCVQALESRARLLVCRTPAAILPAARTVLNPVRVPKLFLKACRCEHGPPALA
jgi:hypothetical protein